MPLEAIRRYQILCAVFKIVNNIGHITINSLRRADHNFFTRHNDLIYGRFGTRMTNQRISIQGAVMFNELPENIKQSNTLIYFQKSLRKYLMEKDILQEIL